MKTPHWCARGLLGLAGLAAFGVLQACYDKEDRCGEGTILSDDRLSCLCPAGEVQTDDGCECPDGFYRNDSGDCEELLIGDACAADEDCVEPFTYCHLPGGYCTIKGCDGPDVCPAPYACLPLPDATTSDPEEMFCKRPPVGEYEPCETTEDCAGTDATWCDPYFKLCYVQGCNLQQNDCFTGNECCDLSTYGVPEPLCIVEGYCVTN